MHPRILAQRQATASARMMKAARKLARHHGLRAETKALEAATNRLPAVQMMMQAEAMADLMEAIAAKMGEMAEAQAEPETIAVPTHAVGPITVETVEVVQEPTKSAAVAAAQKPKTRRENE